MYRRKQLIRAASWKILARVVVLVVLVLVTGLSCITTLSDVRLSARDAKQPAGFRVLAKQKLNAGTTIDERLKASLAKATREKITILIWYEPFGKRHRRTVETDKCGKCEITYDQNKISDPTTKAIVFHFNEMKTATAPLKRNSNHFYVWWSQENPRTLKERGQNLDNFDNFFNLTMTYRRDSDIYSPYGTREDLQHEIWESRTFNQVVEGENHLFQRKKKLAVAFISNCGNSPHSALRMKMVKRLQSLGLKIDLFGDCFPGRRVISRQHMRETIEQYKFYLAFENSFHCRDYITEKFFKNALMYGAVPIAYGARKEDYRAVAPPHSHVHVEDFETSEQLVQYLNYLDKNDTAYREYFQWRLEPPNATHKATKLCQLCRVLHGIDLDALRPQADNGTSFVSLFGESEQPRIVKSLSQWFYGTENEKCLQYV